MRPQSLWKAIEKWGSKNDRLGDPKTTPTWTCLTNEREARRKEDKRQTRATKQAALRWQASCKQSQDRWSAKKTSLRAYARRFFNTGVWKPCDSNAKAILKPNARRFFNTGSLAARFGGGELALVYETTVTAMQKQTQHLHKICLQILQDVVFTFGPCLFKVAVTFIVLASVSLWFLFHFLSMLVQFWLIFGQIWASCLYHFWVLGVRGRLPA